MIPPRPMADETRYVNIDGLTRKVACPRCGQPEPDVCRTRSGKPTWESHRARYEAARARGFLPMVPPPILTDADRTLIRRAGQLARFRATRPKGFVV